MNIDVLGISELKWTGMGEFNSDDRCIYYCGQESLRRNGVALGKCYQALGKVTLPTNVRLVEAMVFPVVIYGCESWTVKKAERRRIDAFVLWCQRRL